MSDIGFDSNYQLRYLREQLAQYKEALALGIHDTHDRLEMEQHAQQVQADIARLEAWEKEHERIMQCARIEPAEPRSPCIIKVGAKIKVKFKHSWAVTVEGELLEQIGNWLRIKQGAGEIGGNVEDLERDVTVLEGK